MPDLVTSAQVLAAIDLSSGDQARVPATITAASTMVRSWCGRYFSRRPSADGTLGPIDELITSPLTGKLLLSEYPINDVLRVSSSKTTVMTVGNTDTTTNQRATCKLTRVGDPITGYITTGLELERWASGVKITNTISFTMLTGQTIQSLAQAVNNIGGGWTASPAQQDGSGIDYALWPVSELRAGQGALGALQDDAEFQAWTDDLGVERDDAAGILTLSNEDLDPFTSVRWGPSQGLTFGDDEIRGQYQGVRVVYDAGYDTIPADLADAVVEVVKALLERKATSSTIESERTGTWTITYREVIEAIPPWAKQVLALYRSHTR